MLLRILAAVAQEEVEKIRLRTKDAQTSIQKIIERDGFYIAKKSGNSITKLGNPNMNDKSKAKEHCKNMLNARSYSKKDPTALALVKSLAKNGTKTKDIISSLNNLHIKISPRTVYNYLK
jgi:predicted transcriptional regulator YheO